MREFFVDAECSEHVGRLQGGARAGRAGTNGALLDRHYQALALDECERHVDVALVPLFLGEERVMNKNISINL